MKLLLISDEEDRYLWDYYQPGVMSDVDIILSAGDLKAEYLSFLVTMINKPLYYIHGNHDITYAKRPPEGCECVDGRFITVNGLRILGLGGCMKYSDKDHQYTEKQMQRRIRRLKLRIRKAGGVDIILTHAPVAGYGDSDNIVHSGFECFKDLIEEYNPKLFVHGHVHQSYGMCRDRVHILNDTQIINACGKYVIEI
ncbi:MAG: metallophosphoesterase [Parasporobacterium sp.]|nr:metallophosphoesterase [Parasporobacterium sp.]